MSRFVAAVPSSGVAKAHSCPDMDRAVLGTKHSLCAMGRAFDPPFARWTAEVTTFSLSVARKPDLIARNPDALRAGQVWICRDRC